MKKFAIIEACEVERVNACRANGFGSWKPWMYRSSVEWAVRTIAEFSTWECGRAELVGARILNLETFEWEEAK
jgi:hypothetical protein